LKTGDRGTIASGWVIRVGSSPAKGGLPMKSTLSIATCLTVLAVSTFAFAKGGGGGLSGKRPQRKPQATMFIQPARTGQILLIHNCH
jgi:hypothetical protein